MTAPRERPGALDAPSPPAPGAAELAGEEQRLLDFAEPAAVEGGGFGWLGDDGAVLADQGVHTWVTGRMTHCFALASLQGRAGADALVDAGLRAFARGGVLRDEVHGGWFASDRDDTKPAYSTAFVVLAAASATVAGRPGAPALLDEALDVVDRRFWDPAEGLVADLWDRTWTRLEPYRGVNANMHTVEALLAAADATGQAEWRHRAGRIVERVVHGFARSTGWRLVEHYDPDWQPRADYNAGERAHPFRPYGVTTGHLLEWARLCLHLRAAQGAAGEEPADWLLDDARALVDVAVADGWDADGREGFVYTTDFDGAPVVRSRMHWVVCEAVAAASALFQVTGEQRYADWHEQWWDHARRLFVDGRQGSWHHELDETNAPASATWTGRPDVYHALQATLVPRLPLAPTFAAALRDALSP